jgi:hypothetical protein
MTQKMEKRPFTIVGNVTLEPTTSAISNNQTVGGGFSLFPQTTPPMNMG